jgi:DNA-binding LacI/PurR family transcriptional regulator
MHKYYQAIDLRSNRISRKLVSETRCSFLNILYSGYVMSSTVDYVATLAGVSKATVSRVLNQRGNVHPDTVKLVREALARAKYEAPLMRQGRGAVGAAGDGAVSLSAYALVVPEMSGGMYSSLLEGFGEAANQRYHQSIVSNTADNLYKQGDEILQLIHKRVGGVAIVPVASAPTPAMHIEAMLSAGIPVVLLHRDVPGVTVPVVELPLTDVGYRAGQALLERGHRRIALFTTPSGPSSILHRNGLRRALEERGLTLSEPCVHGCRGAAPYELQLLERSVDEAFARMAALRPSERPTAIYATNDIIAEVVYMRLMRDGVHVPAQMSLVSFGAMQRVGAIAGRLSSIVVDERSVGSKAVELLEHARASADGSPRRIENVPISLAEGETLGTVTSA